MFGIFDKQPADKKRQETNKLNKKTIASITAASMLTAGTAGAANVEKLPNNELNSEESHNEYVKKTPRPTLKDQAEKVGIKIDPKTIPIDGYNAADNIIAKDGKIASIEEEDRVRIPKGVVDPAKLEKEKNAYYDAYDDAIENGNQFVSPTEKKVSPEQIKTDLEKYYKTSDNETVQKIPDSQSSEELNPEVTTFEIPSNQEQAEKFADKAIQTLSRLMKKFPGALTGKNALLLTTIATSGLHATNNANAANLAKAYNNLESNTSHQSNLTSE